MEFKLFFVALISLVWKYLVFRENCNGFAINLSDRSTKVCFKLFVIAVISSVWIQGKFQ